MTREQIMEQLRRAISNPGQGIRRGQAAFNKLHDMRPNLAYTINGTEYDPFYDDEKIPAFVAWVEKRLYEEGN